MMSTEYTSTDRVILVKPHHDLFMSMCLLGRIETSEALSILGIKASRFSKIKKGKAKIHPELTPAFARLFGITINELGELVLRAEDGEEPDDIARQFWAKQKQKKAAS